ncbi:hypothetical protein Zmor_008569 [Zophobas morio]|uniref:Uncharacterized protein n=1 Tax=Zophobas morio TaxID=2755281 RepID=A0AA38J4I6_9CUCU|nr:hypothetical protein Zmor_008569 [Zophobas morio]
MLLPTQRATSVRPSAPRPARVRRPPRGQLAQDGSACRGTATHAAFRRRQRTFVGLRCTTHLTVGREPVLAAASACESDHLRVLRKIGESDMKDRDGDSPARCDSPRRQRWRVELDCRIGTGRGGTSAVTDR